MSASVVTLANALSLDCTYYAGDPELLNSKRYMERIFNLLQSERGDLLAARVAIIAQLRDALKDETVQEMLKPYLRGDENFEELLNDPKARAKFFSRKQQELQDEVMASKEQGALREAHRDLAAWERENAVLLRHQMFMSYQPSMTLLLESAATISLYRQYAVLGEGEYTSESSAGEVPPQLRRMGDKSLFTMQSPDKEFKVDEHTKMYSQQVLQNKRVEYEEKRALVAERRQALEECSSLQRLQDFINTRNDILRKYGIDRLVSLRGRMDKGFAEPFEGGEDASVQGLLPGNEIMKSRRVAQYSLPKIIDQCHKNYVSILFTDDLDAMSANTHSTPREILKNLNPLKDADTFRHWFLASITADAPQLGPNKLVGKNTMTPLNEYKKQWQPQKSSYVPSLNTSHRQAFARNVAERRGFPHIVVLSPVTYRYMQNNDPNSIVNGEIDLMVYDLTNEKVLLIIVDSHDERRPRGAFLNGHEERYRFAAVIRTAIANDNELHDFQCQGSVAEYFFDPESGSEENYYCIMAPLKLSQKSPMHVQVPVKALRPFTTCPPRYFLLGSNWGVTCGSAQNPYALSFSHTELNEAAIALEPHLPAGFVQDRVLSRLPTRKEGLEQMERDRQQCLREQRSPGSASAAPAHRAPRPSAARPRASAASLASAAAAAAEWAADGADGAGGAGGEALAEEEDPLSPAVPADALRPVREALLERRAGWRQPDFLRRRSEDPGIRQLPAVRDGQLRSPLQVFGDMMREKHGEEEMPQSAPPSARGRMGSLQSNQSKNTPRASVRHAVSAGQARTESAYPTWHEL